MIGFRVQDRGWSVGLDQWVDIALKCRLIPASRFLVNVWILSYYFEEAGWGECHGACFGSRAVSDRDHVSVLLEESSGENQVKQYDLVIVASGLNATGANRLLLEGATAGPFGISFMDRQVTFPRAHLEWRVTEMVMWEWCV